MRHWRGATTSLNLASRWFCVAWRIFTGAFGLKAAQSVVAFDRLRPCEVDRSYCEPGHKVAGRGHSRRFGATTVCWIPPALMHRRNWSAAGEADQVARQHVAWVLEALSSAEREIGYRVGDDLAQRPQAPDRRCPLGARLGILAGRKQHDGCGSGRQFRITLASSVPGQRVPRWVVHALASCVGMDPSLRMRLMAARAIVIALHQSRKDTRGNAGGLDRRARDRQPT